MAGSPESAAGLPDPADLEISVEDASSLLASGARPEGLRVIDCREEDEYLICRIEGAELVPLSRFAEEATGKLGDTEAPYLVYCHHGMRSLRATQFLRRQGFERVWSLAGGINAWSDRIDPTVPRY